MTVTESLISPALVKVNAKQGMNNRGMSTGFMVKVTKGLSFLSTRFSTEIRPCLAMRNKMNDLTLRIVLGRISYLFQLVQEEKNVVIEGVSMTALQTIRLHEPLSSSVDNNTYRWLFVVSRGMFQLQTRRWSIIRVAGQTTRLTQEFLDWVALD